MTNRITDAQVVIASYADGALSGKQISQTRGKCSDMARWQGSLLHTTLAITQACSVDLWQYDEERERSIGVVFDAAMLHLTMISFAWAAYTEVEDDHVAAN